jgi:type I restriction enzyme S subunit
MDNSVASERFAQGSAIPSGWHKARFGDIARNVKVTVDRKNCELDRYVAGEHIETNNLRIKKWGTIGEDYLGPAFNHKFVKGQILYGSRRTYLRKVGVADFDGICANTTFVIEPKGHELIPELLPFIMQSDSFVEHSIRMSKGSVNPYVNWKDIACYEFLIPSIPKQHDIAKILLAAEDCLVKNDQLAGRMATLKKRIVQKLLTTGIKHEEFRDTEIGKIPKEWQIVKFGDICSQRKEIIQPTGEGVIKFIGLEHIIPGEVTTHTYGTDKNIRSSKFKFHSGDILYGKLRPYLDKAVLVDFDGICSTDLLVLTANHEKAMKEFLVYVTHLDRFIKHAISTTSGTNQPRTTWSAIGKFRLGLPPLLEQKRIVDTLLTIEEVASRIRKTNAITKTLKMKLINSLLTEGGHV